MLDPAHLARLGLLVFLLTLYAVVAWQILTRQISLRGLLHADAHGQFSPARLQALITTIGAASWYLGQVLQNPAALPTLPTPLISAVGLSHGFFLSSKIWPLLDSLRKGKPNG